MRARHAFRCVVVLRFAVLWYDILVGEMGLNPCNVAPAVVIDADDIPLSTLQVLRKTYGKGLRQKKQSTVCHV